MPKVKNKGPHHVTSAAQGTISKFFNSTRRSQPENVERQNGENRVSPAGAKREADFLDERPSKITKCSSDSDTPVDARIVASTPADYVSRISESTKEKLDSFRLSDNNNTSDQIEVAHFIKTLSPEEAKLRDLQNCHGYRAGTTGGNTAAKGDGSASSCHKSASSKYTPLELQVVELKAQNPNIVLFIECGYKYRFFGNDAEIAAKELNIYAHMDHNFMTASIPVHRLFVHVRRLVGKGYKVGVVKQTETAALKAAGDTRNLPFTRKLTNLYTKTTLLGEVRSPEYSGKPKSISYLLVPCRYSSPGHQQCVQPITGELVYDMFEDGTTRAELEMRLTHLQPAELLRPQALSNLTEKLLKQTSAIRGSTDDQLRVECVSDAQFNYNTSKKAITDFFEVTSNKNKGVDAASSLADVLRLPKAVQSCYHALLKYLEQFQLSNVLTLTSNIQQFSSRQNFMQLSASTVQNLELFHNSSTGGSKGTVFTCIDHTKTRFGKRRLQAWLSKPLMDVCQIEARLDAVTELLKSHSAVLDRLRSALMKVADLERGLTAIFHHKCSPSEFLSVCRSLQKVHDEVKGYQGRMEAEVESVLLRKMLDELPQLLGDVPTWVQAIDEGAASGGDKPNLFVDESNYPGIVQCKTDIRNVRVAIKNHLPEVGRILQIPRLEYVKVSGVEFLIEVKNSQAKSVPADWVKISGTKAVGRYHTPFIVDAIQRLNQHQEQLDIEAKKAWDTFLSGFEECYPRYKQAVDHLATLDCLFSLATMAKQDGYCRPTLTENPSGIKIKQGRHLVVEAIKPDQEQVVPNDTLLEDGGECCMVVTGPNMGGKSSYIKQVAVICILAQMGAYVPAESAEMGLLDAVYTRMGASDELFKGRSTFMVELQETAEILDKVTSRSLVILDELGRGTSTHDGVAIAYAVLDYCVTKVKCLSLFVTHYPQIAEAEALYNGHVTNYHMSFFVNEDEDAEGTGSSFANDPESITFLYQLVRGPAARSYGLNVARLAGIPAQVIKEAAHKSAELENTIQEHRLLTSKFLKVYGGGVEAVKDLSSS